MHGLSLVEQVEESNKRKMGLVGMKDREEVSMNGDMGMMAAGDK